MSKEQFQKLLQLAQAGDANAQNNVAIALINSNAGDEALQAGIHWLKSAADQGLATALFNLGAMYKGGHKLSKNQDEALSLFKAAAAKGYAPAMVPLAMMYRDGEGVPQDRAEAMRLLLEAATKGHQLAQLEVGLSYFSGVLCEKNLSEALFWLNKVSGKVPVETVHIFADALGAATDLPNNLEESAKWYLIAAERGYVASQAAMVRLYNQGIGVEKNETLAEKWREAILDSENFEL